MKETYVLNPKNGRIHIVGYCHLTNPHPKEWKGYKTEDDARSAFGAQSAGLCKLCLQAREVKLQKENKAR